MEITSGFAEYVGRQLTKEKEMTKFKAGDKVVRTEDYTWNDDNGFMQVGKEYIVVEASEKVLVLKGDFNNVQYDPDMFKLVKPAHKNMKFRVSSPEHSKEIQEALFEMGYEWVSGSKEILHTHELFLYTDAIGTIMTGSLEDTFKESHGQEHTVEVVKSYKLIPVATVKQSISVNGSITINGKTYDKEAVLKRLAELEEVL